MNFKKFNGSTWNAIRHKTYDTLTETLDRTENLYDPSDAPVAMYPNQSTGAVEASTSGTITCSVIVQVEPNTEYTASFDTPSSGVRRRIGMYSQLPSVGLSAEAVDNTAGEISGRSYNTFTTTANTAYILFMFYSKSASSGGSADEAKRIAKTITVRKGTSHVFVPYGFRLQASGDPLTDYTIYGNTGGVGDKTANLADESAVTENLLTEDGQVNSNTNYRLTPYFENTSGLCIDIDAIIPNADKVRVGIYDQNHDFVERRLYDKNVLPIVIAPSDGAYIRVNWAIKSYDTETIMINAGSTALPYEPYGYVIPVTSGGVTTNLYTDSPLGLTDTLTYTDTGIALPTVDGDNTITFGTTVQPSAMSATFKGWHPLQAAKQYDGAEWR